MPEFTGRLRLTRLPDHPANPQPGEVYYNTAEDQIYLWNGTEWRPSNNPGPQGPKGDKGDTGAQGPQGAAGAAGPPTVIPVVTALPSSPADGTEVYYRHPGQRKFWHLRYDSDDTVAPYKAGWRFLGGSPLFVSTNGTVAAGLGTTMKADLPQIAPPLTGMYDLQWGCACSQTTDATLSALDMGINLLDGSGTLLHGYGFGAKNLWGSIAVAATCYDIWQGGVFVSAYYQQLAALAASYRQRWLSMVPYWIQAS